MSTILSAVCPLEAAVIVSTESLYLLARQRQRRKQRWTQVRGFQRFVFICNYATSTITEGYEWEQTPSNGLANHNPTPPHTKRTTLRRNDISTAFTHRITASIFNNRRRRIGVIWGGGRRENAPSTIYFLPKKFFGYRVAEGQIKKEKYFQNDYFRGVKTEKNLKKTVFYGIQNRGKLLLPKVDYLPPPHCYQQSYAYA